MAKGMPTYSELMLPTLRAVSALGGSGSVREIRERVLADLDPPEDLLAQTYDNREKSVYLDRLAWARSYCKLSGTLESPRRGMFLLTTLGRELVALTDDEAAKRLRQLDGEVRRARRSGRSTSKVAKVEEEEALAAGDEDATWKEVLVARLHRLSPDAFEEFALYLLRTFGLELERIGGSGDEGIDGIGTAPLSPVLSATVAIQAKRYEPSRTIGRETVALFQRDAAAAGAERAVMVTLGRYSEPARRAATKATPTIDLIDGDRLCDLVRDQEMGVQLVPQVDESWFDRFDK